MTLLFNLIKILSLDFVCLINNLPPVLKIARRYSQLICALCKKGVDVSYLQTCSVDMDWELFHERKWRGMIKLENERRNVTINLILLYEVSIGSCFCTCVELAFTFFCLISLFYLLYTYFTNIRFFNGFCTLIRLCSGLVYYLKCHGCDATYIGETVRLFRLTVQEHNRFGDVFIFKAFSFFISFFLLNNNSVSEGSVDEFQTPVCLCSSLVYYLKCHGCDATYIGETVRLLCTRFWTQYD